MSYPVSKPVDMNRGNDLISFPPDTDQKPRHEFTCFNCKDEFECPYAYDWYNTDGDCLGNK